LTIQVCNSTSLSRAERSCSLLAILPSNLYTDSISLSVSLIQYISNKFVDTSNYSKSVMLAPRILIRSGFLLCLCRFVDDYDPTLEDSYVWFRTSLGVTIFRRLVVRCGAASFGYDRCFVAAAEHIFCPILRRNVTMRVAQTRYFVRASLPRSTSPPTCPIRGSVPLTFFCWLSLVEDVSMLFGTHLRQCCFRNGCST
jgi:hypothetical protein